MQPGRRAMLYFIPRDVIEETMLYRFSCLDAHDQAVSTEEIEARSLIDAIAKAHMMLKSRPHHETVEVWRGNNLAYQTRNGPILAPKWARGAISEHRQVALRCL